MQDTQTKGIHVNGDLKKSFNRVPSHIRHDGSAGNLHRPHYNRIVSNEQVGMT